MYMWTTNVNTSFFNLDMSMDSSPSYSKSRHTSLVLASGIREPPSYGLHTTWRHHSLVLPMKPSMNPQNDFLLQTHLPGSSLSGEGCGGGPISWFLLLVSISLTSRTTEGGDGTHFIQQFFCFLPRKLINKFLQWPFGYTPSEAVGDFPLLFPPVALHGTHACLFWCLDLFLDPFLFLLMLRGANLILLSPVPGSRPPIPSCSTSPLLAFFVFSAASEHLY